jgi:hypothetical protein
LNIGPPVLYGTAMMQRLARRSEQANLARAAAALVAAFAILMQLMLAPPLLLRMAADAAWLAAIPTSHAGVAPGPVADAGEPGQPALPAHDHAHCVLCQSHLVPLLAVAVALPLIVAACWRLATQAAGAAMPRGRRRFESYASRAPPALIA